MSFIPLITSSPKFHAREAAITYFLAQALGSGLILLGSFALLSNPHIIIPPYLSSIILLIGLLVKLGLPPCHFWFPRVISIISWPICIILSTWQKLTPILILFYTTLPNIRIISISIIILRSLIRGLGGLNQTQLRPLLAYSSIGHISWILAARIRSYSSRILYLIIYILITLSLISLFSSSSSYSNLTSLNISSTSTINTTNLFILVLSLGGLPPFLGFFPKWIVIETISPSFSAIILITLLGSVINLYYYINLIFINILPKKKIPLIIPTRHKVRVIIPLISTLTLGLGPIILILVYALTLLN